MSAVELLREILDDPSQAEALATKLKRSSSALTISGSIVGTGIGERKTRSVRWGVAGRIVWAWIFTIPAAALISVAAYFVLHGVGRLF